MRIAIVSDYAEQGGAAIACNRLAVALAAQGAEVCRFSLDRGRRPELACVEFAPEPFGRRVGALIGALDAFGCEEAARRWRLREAVSQLHRAFARWQPEIVNVHNLHGFSPKFFLVPGVHARWPVVWTLHDQWSFTGRCSYSFDCPQFVARCTASCPTAHEYPALPAHAVPGEWEKRRAFFSQNQKIAAITPSDWLSKFALSGLWQGHEVHVIPNSLDLNVFRPIERQLARVSLGLPVDKRPMLLLAADYLHERRKGAHLLLPLLQELAGQFTLLTMGHQPPRDLLPRVSAHHLGYVVDDRLKALAYSAADLLLHPAPVDNLPNTVMEALACGTPVLAFAVGGLPEMVWEGETGWLAFPCTAEALIEKLRTILIAQLGIIPDRVKIRAFCEDHYAPQIQASAYLKVFQRQIALRRGV